MLSPLPLLAALAALLVSGLVHGFWTQRWQTSTALDEACSRLEAVPNSAGTWQSSTVAVDPEPFQQAQVAGYWMRRYTQGSVPGSFTVILMCGRAGPMAVHTPDICYRGAGYEIVGVPVRETVTEAIGQPAADYWTARFHQPGKAAGHELQIFWAWSSDGSWQAPTSPRWTFAGQPYLFKLYVVREAPPWRPGLQTPAQQDDKLAVEFLRQLLPELRRSLFSAKTTTP
jgi:hypothetical protein